MNNLILFGHKNCGKTYWGERIAKKFGLTWIDTDHLIEELYQKKSHSKQTCAEIYSIVGERKFRAFEHESIVSIKGVVHAVISLGGGTLFFQKNLTLLSKIGSMVYLKAEKELLRKRTLSQPLPNDDSIEDFDASFEFIYQERTPFYERLSAYHIDLNIHSEDEIMTCVKEILDGK